MLNESQGTRATFKGLKRKFDSFGAMWSRISSRGVTRVSRGRCSSQSEHFDAVSLETIRMFRLFRRLAALPPPPESKDQIRDGKSPGLNTNTQQRASTCLQSTNAIPTHPHTDTHAYTNIHSHAPSFVFQRRHLHMHTHTHTHTHALMLAFSVHVITGLFSHKVYERAHFLPHCTVIFKNSRSQTRRCILFLSRHQRRKSWDKHAAKVASSAEMLDICQIPAFIASVALSSRLFLQDFRYATL